MKKFLAMLLAIVMVLPMVLVANAETVTKKPFYGLSWSAVDESQQEYIRKGYTINTLLNSKTKEPRWQLPGVGEDMDQIGKAIAKEMDRLPEGMRQINLNAFGSIFYDRVEDVIYLHEGAERAAKHLEELMKVCKKYNAKLEGIIMDFEYIGLASHYLTTKDYANDPLIFHKIVQNPRYATDVRPLLEERGFQFYPNPTEHTPEIWAANKNSGEEYDVSRAIWDTVMRIRLNKYIDQAIYEPAIKYYPDIIVADYHSQNSYSWLKDMDGNGDPTYLGGNSFYVGNTSNSGTYSTELGNYFTVSGGSYVYQKPDSYSGAVFEADAFHQTLYNANYFKNLLAATPNGNINIWIAEHDYPYGTHVNNTGYWTETLFHLGMLDPNPFLIYMYTPDFKDKPGVYDARMVTISQVLAELTRVAGYSDRKVIPTPADWNLGFVLSGMYANGRNIWRLTPDTTDGLTLESFKVEGTDPTFTYKGKTITFPGGKIIADGEVSPIGTCGYWIETAKDVVPVITTDADRFLEFPAYLEDFESYEAGKKFTASNAKYPDTWVTQTKSKNPAMVIADGDNQLMELTGTTWLVNEKLPANITAGDYYAKNQEWRVTATIPANMGADEEVVLLKYEGSGQAYDDCGFKVANGKVYYDKEGKYVEIPGLDVSAGGKYTFKRVLHFSDEGFTSDYHVLNAEGKAIAGVKGVTVADIQLPVLSITVGCKKLAGKLLLDDYSLNAYGTHADFELYGAKFGMPVEDITKAQNEATAYRLSWQNNTTNAQTTAKVVAEFYEGNNKVSEEILQEMTWAPGCDGVVTGIVEVKDGQSVKLTLLTEEQKLSPDDEVISGTDNTGDNGNNDNNNNNNNTDNNNTGNNTGKKPAGMNIGVIVFIAVAVLGVVFLVVVLVVVKKPAKKAAKVEEVDAPAEAPAEEAPASEETETPDAE